MELNFQSCWLWTAGWVFNFIHVFLSTRMSYIIDFSKNFICQLIWFGLLRTIVFFFSENQIFIHPEATLLSPLDILDHYMYTSDSFTNYNHCLLSFRITVNWFILLTEQINLAQIKDSYHGQSYSVSVIRLWNIFSIFHFIFHSVYVLYHYHVNIHTIHTLLYWIFYVFFFSTLFFTYLIAVCTHITTFVTIVHSTSTLYMFLWVLSCDSVFV